MASPSPSVDDLLMQPIARLDDVIDHDGLRELARSFYRLFRLPVRLFGETQGLLVQVGGEPELYSYLRGFLGARAAVDGTISAVLGLSPEPGEQATYECFTGAAYRVIPIVLEARRIGKLVLGPYLPPEVKRVRREIIDLDAELDPSHVKRLLASLPRAKPETVLQIADHMSTTLDLILFSGHKALITNKMHLMSVREGFTQLQQKNERLEEAHEGLKEVDRLKSNLLATVSHELRTPLTSIIGYSEMLKEGLAGPISDEQRSFVTTIFEKGTQLLELLTGLLDLSKLDSGTVHMRAAEVDVTKLVDDVLQTLAPGAQKAGVQLRAELDPAAKLLRGDPMRLRQVLLNLTENALKFTEPGGTVSIESQLSSLSLEPPETGGLVLLAAKQPALQLVVRDTGVGIPDQEKAKVFGAFYQVDSGTTRHASGTGLGLSIVSRIVEAHQGQIQIEDNLPRGTAFVVSIPLRHVTLS